MKSFKEFLEEEKKKSYQIYCDMDGVLVDFIEGVKIELDLKRDPNQKEIDTFLSTLAGSSKEFWSELPWMSDGKKLWDTLKDLNTEILSACPNNCKLQPSVKIGKKMWCRENLKISQGINITTRKGKLRFVGEKTILIDDFRKNTKAWEAKGGIAIYHRNARATLVELKKILLG
tara:strand:- start:1808 stop:2329 length:522 start_codon:yes stop_codon:yes gene_type:complete